VNAVYRERRGKVFQLLETLKCEFSMEQAGMFVWAKIPAGYPDGYALSDKVLNEAGVFLTPGGIFGSAGDPYIRVSLCAPVERFQESIHRIKEAGL